MRSTALLSILFLLVLPFAPAFGQSVLGDTPVDGVFVRGHIADRKPIPYASLRESDVMWKKRVWRMIDLREKMNLPLYYPFKETNGMKSLGSLLYDAVTKEVSLRVYSNSVDEDFSVEWTPTEVKNITEKSREVTVPSFLTGDDSTYTTSDEFSPRLITKFLLKEEWFFDKQRSVLDCRILGICPLYYDEEKGSDVSLFWVYFPEARHLLANHDVFNRSNPNERRSFDDIFWKRQFSSYIIKEENVYDRWISDYTKGMEALLESDRIKQEIVNFEHDLWEF